MSINEGTYEIDITASLEQCMESPPGSIFQEEVSPDDLYRSRK